LYVFLSFLHLTVAFVDVVKSVTSPDRCFKDEKY
jgi:hypothetical protein